MKILLLLIIVKECKEESGYKEVEWEERDLIFLLNLSSIKVNIFTIIICENYRLQNHYMYSSFVTWKL